MTAAWAGKGDLVDGAGILPAGAGGGEVLEEAPSLRDRPWKLNLARAALAVACLAAWEGASGTLIDKFWLSKPTEIGARLTEWIASGYLLRHLSITLQETFYGFLLGATAGIVFGFLMGRFLTLAQLLEPFVQAVYSLPRLALAPLFILWFGIGLQMKVILAGVIVFFLVFWNTYAGVKDVDDDLLDVVRIIGANGRQMLLKVMLPSALAWIFVGLKVSVPYALIGAVVGEIVASNRGLGFIIQYSAGQFDTAGIFAALFVLMAVAVVLNEVLDRGERHFLRWKRVSR